MAKINADLVVIVVSGYGADKIILSSRIVNSVEFSCEPFKFLLRFGESSLKVSDRVRSPKRIVKENLIRRFILNLGIIKNNSISFLFI